MFKKKETKHINAYDMKWNDIVSRRFDIARDIDQIYADIQFAADVMFCFKQGSPNWEAENKRLEELRYKMLCKCGGYDSTSYELKELLNKHKNELQPQFCLNYSDLLISPVGDCNMYLRSIAKNFKQYGRVNKY